MGFKSIALLASLLIACGLQLIFSAAVMAADKTYLLATKEPPVTGRGPVGKVVSVVKDVPKRDLVKGQILNKHDLLDPVVKTDAKIASSTPAGVDRLINDCTAVIKRHPHEAKAYLDRGGAYVKKGQLQQAIADFSRAIKLEPKNFYFYEVRGSAYLLQGLSEMALQDSNQAVRLAPQNYFRYWNRAMVYQQLKQDQRAIADCSEAIRLAPEQPYIYNFRAKLYLGLKSYDKALVDCDKAISLIPHNQCKYEYADLYVQRAWVYRRIGNLSKALADCDRAIACEPYVSSTFLTGAAAKCLKGVNQVKGICAAYSTRGVIRLEQGQAERALEDLNRALKLDSECARCYALRALVYRKMGMEQKAIDDLSTAKKLDPKVGDPVGEGER